MLAKIIRWAIFGVIVSLIPLWVSYEILVIKLQSPTLGKILGNGELLIIVWVLCAGALGELVGSGPSFRILKLFSGGGTLATLIICALMFASISEERSAHISINTDEIVSKSLLLFCFGILSCVGCLSLSER